MLFQVAHAHQQLGDSAKAARYLFDCVTLLRPNVGEDESLLSNVRYYFAETTKLAELKPHLKPEEFRIVEGRLKGETPGSGLAPMYGQAYGECPDLYAYDYQADSLMLKRWEGPVLQSKEVSLSGSPVRTVIIRLTAAGLWVQGCTREGVLLLYFSESADQWKRIATPDAMSRPTQQVREVVQQGRNVYFATGASIHILNLDSGEWREVGIKQGLTGGPVQFLAPDSDTRSIWMLSGDHIARYDGVNVFLSKVRTDYFLRGFAAMGNRLLTLKEGLGVDELLSIDPQSGAQSLLLAGGGPVLPSPAPRFLTGPRRFFNAGVIGVRRIFVGKDRLFVVTVDGLQVLTTEGKPVCLWRPGGFFFQGELGGWVEGNCPLPPCLLTEVISDDQDPDVLWLVSKHQEPINPYWFERMLGGKELRWLDFSESLLHEFEALTFVTAFNTKKEVFSNPVRTATPFVFIQPRGAEIYFTGKTCSRLAKTAWVLDQAASNQALRVKVPDTVYGRASEAFLRGEITKARSLMTEASKSGPAPEAAKRILVELEKLP